jgi:hypothetical protein
VIPGNPTRAFSRGFSSTNSNTSSTNVWNKKRNCHPQGKPPNWKSRRSSTYSIPCHDIVVDY